MNIRYLHFDIDLEQAERDINAKEFSWTNHRKEIILAFTYSYHIKEFLSSEDIYNEVIDSLNKAIVNSLDDGDKLKDDFYIGIRFENKGDKNYNKYKQINQTYLIAAIEYVDIILKNKDLFETRFSLLKFTIHFYKCFQIIEEKELMYFDLDKLVSYSTIDESFLPVLEALRDSNKLKNLVYPIKNYKKPTVTQIALKLIYEGQIVTRENGNKLIAPYGYKSGEKLYQKYTDYLTQGDRRATPDPLTKITFQNKIKLFEGVLKILSDQFKSNALADLNYLKSNFNKEFE